MFEFFTISNANFAFSRDVIFTLNELSFLGELTLFYLEKGKLDDAAVFIFNRSIFSAFKVVKKDVNSGVSSNKTKERL